MTNLVTHLEETVSTNGERPAVVFRGQEIPYRGLWNRAGRFAAGLTERGFEPDDRVGIYLPNLPPFVTAFHGTLRAGGVVVPINPQYKAREIEHLLADSGAEVVVTMGDLVSVIEQVRPDTAVDHVVTVDEDHEAATSLEAFLADEPAPTVERADDDIAAQPYTSGTTGQPKGVLLTHGNLASNATISMELAPEGGLTPEDSMLGVLPLFHIYGMTVVMNATLFAGGSFYPLPTWEPDQAAGLIEEAGLTIMHGVPAMYNDLINREGAESADFSSLRMCGVGGAGIPREVLRTFEDLYDVRIFEGYGLTETSPVTHFNQPNRGRRVGSIGQPAPGVDAKVVDEDFESVERIDAGPVDEEDTDLDAITGEIVVAGPNVMAGYAGLPEATAEAFTERDGTRWFHTGDVAYWDADDYFYVVDRMKHVIVTAGYNVYPREVEELLFEHPAVADAAVVGIPDERRIETVKAYVVPTPDADVTADDIREYCLEHLAEYKHPREVEFVEELPRTTTGKVKKFELVGEAAEPEVEADE